MKPGSGLGRFVRSVGLLLYGVIGAVPYFGSPLIVPYPAAFVLWAIWLIGLVIAIRLSRSSPWAALLSAVSALLIWVFFVQIGSWIFGWTA